MNPWEAMARRTKAERIAHVLFTERIPSSVAAESDQIGREKAAKLIGVRKPSPQTWSLVVEILKQKEKDNARD